MKSFFTLLLAMSWSMGIAIGQLSFTELSFGNRIYEMPTTAWNAPEIGHRLKLNPPQTNADPASTAEFEQGMSLLGIQFGINHNGGNQGTNSNNSKLARTTNISLLLCYQYFLAAQLSVGGFFGYDYSSTKNAGSDNGFSNGEFVIYPFIRAYFLPFSLTTLAFFAQFGTRFGFGTAKQTTDQGEFKDNLFRFQLALAFGMAWFITQRVMLELSLGDLGWGIRNLNEKDSDFRRKENEVFFNLVSKGVTLSILFRLGAFSNE
ncbi:hypothetical protein [Pontibacter sp. G13]|uniref:hypothetical protein n=1 Tax=Pontibacter sp. G13 TaxID=3074898 RepID=UPI00288AB620|nr:hypothetical protein [Pontibacter sp. G13]WNJ18531.1 hypothetical protein RJD25_27055 [Pontibacter sp. G13]